MTKLSSSPSRRQFLKGSGGALVMAFSLSSPVTGSESAQDDEDEEELPGSLAENSNLDSWIEINTDGTVTVFTGKAELGQGIQTALAQVAAEELDVNFDRTTMVTADTERTPDEGYTAGSQSMEDSGTAIRYAAAEARDIMLGMAAARLDADKDRLSVDDGTVAADGEQTNYWDLVGGRYFHHEVTGEIEPKSPDEYDVVGEGIGRLDIPDKVTGGQSYVHDMRGPDMLHARVVHPPGYGAELVSVDGGDVEDMPGVVRTVRDGDFLAVIATGEHQAVAAMESLREAAEWNVRPTMPDQDRLYESLRQEPSNDEVIEESGSPDGVEDADRTLEATYHRPYQMHGSIGPSCAVAQFTDDGLHVWTHSQGVYPLRESLAELLEMPGENITCTHVEGSGCYGHNGADDVAAEAALLSRHTDGRPVRVQWMREDEHRWEPYGSAMVMEVQGGVDSDGNVVGWDYDVWSHTHSTRPGGAGNLLPGRHIDDDFEMPPPPNIPQPSGGGDRNAIPLYEFENRRVTHHFLPQMEVRVSALRALGAYGNVFALESFVDELAATAEVDPVTFRLGHLTDDRARDVIRTAADEAGWDGWESEENRGIGIAFAQYKNLAAYTAVVVEVTVDPDSGEISVDRAVAANDSGQIVNPDGIRNQIEGGIVQSTSWTLKERVNFDRDQINSQDWESYPMLTFPEVPEVEVTLIDRPGEPYLGTGEAAQGPTAAAIANAVSDATGARVREIPLTPERVQSAMDEAQ